MEQTNTQLNANTGKSLFEIKFNQTRASEAQSHFVVASSLEEAITLFKNRWKSYNIPSTHLIACEKDGPSSPVAPVLLIGD